MLRNKSRSDKKQKDKAGATPAIVAACCSFLVCEVKALCEVCEKRPCVCVLFVRVAVISTSHQKFGRGFRLELVS